MLSPILLINNDFFYIIGGYSTTSENIDYNYNVYIISITTFSCQIVNLSSNVYTDTLIPKQRAGGVLFNNSIHYFQGNSKPNAITTWQIIDLLTFNLANIEYSLAQTQYSYSSNDEMIYFFGGINSKLTNALYQVSLLDMNFSILSNDFLSPSDRAFSSLIAIEDNLLLFAGENKGQAFNDLWVFSTTEVYWEYVNVLGDIPSNRSKHGCTFEGNQMFIFGGENEEFLNDLYGYNYLTNYWSLLSTVSIWTPTPRSGACIQYFEGAIYIYGGRDTSGILNDFWYYDLNSEKYTQLNSSLYAIEDSKCFIDKINEFLYVLAHLYLK